MAKKAIKVIKKIAPRFFINAILNGVYPKY